VSYKNILNKSKINNVTAREILDSRGNPTVEADVQLSDGSLGRASIPSGASTGSREALELRDGDDKRYGGYGVLKAVGAIKSEIKQILIGNLYQDQRALDQAMIELDGTHDKSRLGANSILPVSIAFARASATSLEQSLYSYIADQYDGTKANEGYTIPVPMFNIINGGKHAYESTDFQEFMVIPSGFKTYEESLRAGAEIYHNLKRILQERGKTTIVGDEGGFAPSLKNNRQALEWILTAIETAGYMPGKNCHIAIDVAATELQISNESATSDYYYDLTSVDTILNSEKLIGVYDEWVGKYPLISIEDGMAETDWIGWQNMTSKLGNRVQVVGDDLYATNTSIIKTGINSKASNAVLIKPNQIGTLTETLDAIATTRDAGWSAIISHRSAETEDTMIADLAIGTGTRQIKAGAPARSERTAKYNRLLNIEAELAEKVSFAGNSAYQHFLDI
jgi:enolase